MERKIFRYALGGTYIGVVPMLGTILKDGEGGVLAEFVHGG